MLCVHIKGVLAASDKEVFDESCDFSTTQNDPYDRYNRNVIKLFRTEI